MLGLLRGDFSRLRHPTLLDMKEAEPIRTAKQAADLKNSEFVCPAQVRSVEGERMQSPTASSKRRTLHRKCDSEEHVATKRPVSSNQVSSVATAAVGNSTKHLEFATRPMLWPSLAKKLRAQHPRHSLYELLV